MATILLGAAGAALGSSIGGSLLGVSAAALGRAAGASLGGLIDQKLSGQQNRTIESGKIDSFRLQSGTEGAPIGRATGRNRIAGQVIWASDFVEAIASNTSGGGKFNTKPTVTTQAYSYSISLALALCEGEIVKVGRIWADGQEISRSDLAMTVYAGTADQEPDLTIASLEGVDKTPAFRGTAYVVFDNLQLANFGNRVPQFNFEVFRRAEPKNIERTTVNDLLQGVALMPGSGEYVLATTPVNYSADYGVNQSANVHTNRGQADIIHVLDDLSTDLPNANSVLLVSSWFGDDLRCGSCNLEPKVEQLEIDGAQMPWNVSGTSRWVAREVSKDDGRPVFGGTPSDQSVLEAIAAISSQGKDVVFYPFVMMDIQQGNGLTDPWGGVEQAVIPWRGRVTASVAPGRNGTPDKTASIREEIDAFFGNAQVSEFTPIGQTVQFTGSQQWSYRRFILHYAHLCALAGGVDAFCIGSELRGLTSLRDEVSLFPVVEHLIKLADDVRQILGPDTKIGYAADWTEYFGYQPADGSGDLFFHLDELWSHDNIDFVGIDNYMPLSDWRDSSDHLDVGWGFNANLDYLKSNIEGGEGFDWYYASVFDREAQIRTPITDGAYDEPWVYRYKDIRNWWQQWHFDRIAGVRQSGPTTWQPQSKPIWFTEFGFPAVDKGTNQPNVFIDPKSSESSAPYFSNLEQDPVLQANGLRAVSEYWSDDNLNPDSTVYEGKMVDIAKAHVWAWDARPWPDFPLRTNIWSDGKNYALGHWLSGRLGGADLAMVVAEICEICGLTNYDVSALNGIVNGLWLKGSETGREALQILMTAYDFSCVEDQGVLVFASVVSSKVATVTTTNLVVSNDDQDHFAITRNASEAVVEHVSLGFWDSDQDYQFGQLEARKYTVNQPAQLRYELPLVLRKSEASKIVDRQLHHNSFAKNSIEFKLPMSELSVAVGDVVQIDEAPQKGRFRIESIEEQGYRIVQAVRIRSGREVSRSVENVASVLTEVVAPNPIFAKFVDLPRLSDTDGEIGPYIAITAKPWPGGGAVFSSVGGDEYSLEYVTYERTTIGTSLQVLPKGEAHRWSESDLLVELTSGSLSSVTEENLLNGANLVAIRGTDDDQWEIFQYQYAELQQNGSYVLSRFLRGQFGTDTLTPSVHPVGSELVFIKPSLGQMQLPPAMLNTEKAVRYGATNLPLNSDHFTNAEIQVLGVGARPFAPVHLRQRKLESGDIVLSWIRRTRAIGDFWAASEVPLDETEQAYRVTFYLGDQAIRSADASQPSYTYTLAEQNVDGVFGSIQVSVAQISEIYGPGLETRISVNV